jgi:hypothetical protein
MNFKLTLIFFASVLVWGCKTNSIANREEQAKTFSTLNLLENQKDYDFEINVVYPFNTQATTQVATTLLMNTGNSPNRIDVRGDGNYIKIANDSIKAYLPFFGESRMDGGEYGGRNISIEIDEALDDLKKQINQEKERLELEFSAHQKGNDNDKYDVKIEIYSNYKASIHITPVFRTFIRYDGELINKDADN